MASPAPRYARAFAEVAGSAGLNPAAARQQLADFAETLSGSSDLRQYLENPSVETASKLKVLDAVAARIKMFPKVRNFLAVILEHHRLMELDQILTAYGEIADQHAGAVEARITSSRPLSPENRTHLESQIAKLAGANVRATYLEDSTLLGGVIVEIGTTIYDGSLRAQLQQLKHKLVTA